MTRKNKTFRVEAMPEDLTNRLFDYLEASGGKGADFLEASLNCLTTPPQSAFEFSDELKSQMATAARGLNESVDEFIRKAIENRVALSNRGKNDKRQDGSDLDAMSLEELIAWIQAEKGRGLLKGLGEKKVEKFIKKLMAHNDACQEKDDKAYISATFTFSQLARMGANTHRNYINKFFAENESMIQKHNAKHKLDDRHNSKKFADGFNWAV